MIGYFKNKYNRIAALPPRVKYIAVAAVASPLLRNFTTPAMLYDLYTDVDSLEEVSTLKEAFAEPDIQNKIAIYAIAWLAMHAVQWGGGAYVTAACARQLITETPSQP